LEELDKKKMKNKGQGMSSVVGFVAFAILIMVGSIVFSSFDTSASSLLSSNTAASAATANLSANTYNAFNMVSIGPIIYGAVIILGLVGLLYLRSK